MSTLWLIIAFISLLIWSAGISHILNEKMQKYSVIVAVSFKVIFLFIAMQFTTFSSARIALYLSTSLIFLGLLTRPKKLLIEHLKKHQIFLFSAVIWFFLTYNVQILFNDEFFWASFVKHITLHDTFWQTTHQLVNARYLPGLPIWQSLFTSSNLTNEQSLLFALGLIFFIVFEIVANSKQMNLFKKIILFIVYCTLVYCYSPIGVSSLYVDTTVGVIFAACLWCIHDATENKDFITAIFLFLFMGLIKETAFLLSILCFFVLLIKIIRTKKTFKVLATTFAGFLVLILNFYIWQNYLKAAHLTDGLAHNVFQSLLNDLNSVTTRTAQTIQIFINAAMNRKLPISLLAEKLHLNFLSGNLITNFMFYIPILIYFRKQFEFLAGYIVGLIGYVTTLLFFWLYLTSDYEGYNLASYERYLGTFFLAIGLLSLKLILESDLVQKKSTQIALAAFIVLFPPSPKMLIPPTFKKNLPQILIQKIGLNTVTDSDQLQPILEKVQAKTPPDAKIWLIWQKSDGYHLLVARYKLAPRAVLNHPTSIGQPYSTADVWTKKLSTADFVQYLQTTDFIAIGLVDDNFRDHYSHFFINPLQSNTLYKKISTPEGYKLSEAQ